MNVIPEFEQNHFSRTSKVIHEFGHVSIHLMNWLAYYDRSYYEITNCYDMMRSILKI